MRANIVLQLRTMLPMLPLAKYTQVPQGLVVQSKRIVHHPLTHRPPLTNGELFVQPQHGVALRTKILFSRLRVAPTTLLSLAETAKLPIPQVCIHCIHCSRLLVLVLISSGPSASLAYHPDRIGVTPTNNTAQAIFSPQACVFVAK